MSATQELTAIRRRLSHCMTAVFGAKFWNRAGIGAFSLVW